MSFYKVFLISFNTYIYICGYNSMSDDGTKDDDNHSSANVASLFSRDPLLYHNTTK